MKLKCVIGACMALGETIKRKQSRWGLHILALVRILTKLIFITYKDVPVS